MKLQRFQDFLPTRFVHPVSSFKKDITAVAVEISTTTAIFTNTFCPISRIKISVNEKNIYSGVGLERDEDEYKIIKDFDSLEEAMAEIRKPEYSPSVYAFSNSGVGFADVSEYFIEHYDTDWYDEDGWCESPELLGYSTPWKFIFDDEEGKFTFKVED